MNVVTPLPRIPAGKTPPRGGMDHARRLKAVKDLLDCKGLDSVLITHEANVRYLTGLAGHDCTLLITRQKNYCITDSRYIQDAQEQCDRHYTVTLAKHSAFEAISDYAHTARLKSLGFEGMHLAYSVARNLKKYCGNARLKPTTDLVETIRAVKEPAEIAAIRRSIALTRKVLKRTTSAIKPGITERSIADSIEISFRRAGSQPSFPVIVASGSHASKPHAQARAHAIRNNTFIMIDMGCIVDGYCSDLTRMVSIGKTGSRYRRIYGIVRAAQEAAIALIRDGVKISDIDRAARSHIERSGFGAHFGHALGHGVGLEIHERPNVSMRNKGIAQAGMVMTIEPAIYLPGFGGVRIEDMVLVTPKGCEILTR